MSENLNEKETVETAEEINEPAFLENQNTPNGDFAKKL